MTKLKVFTAFAVLFLSSILVANGIYSNQVFALDGEQNGNNHDQNGNLNEAEINTDIEQENKCKKHTECENENEINNQLSITTITQAQQQEEQPETPTCETCFTDNLSEDAIGFIEETFFTGEPSSLQEICDYIDENIEGIAFQSSLAFYLYEDVVNNSDATTEDIDNVVDCIEELFGVDLPRPPFT